ncbi:MAG: PorP/SprF family type IX secretion system membrane protein [Chitinophagales bacterium]|jgi:type IX secretion system PorP/SprF family membrane protein|nr:PorP/SprF family type IX secretion system membrane protein [Chitinophagales bacterium]
MPLKVQYRILLASLLLILSGILPAQAQDVHFTQYNEAPILLNPANIGFYKSQYRFNANIRNQWNTKFVNNNNVGVTGTGFQTAAGSFDMTVNVTKSSPDRLGVGVQLFSDQAGEVALRTTSGLVGVSYWKNIQKFTDKYVVFGATAGFVDKRIDYTNLQLPDQYNFFDPFRPLTAVSYPTNDNITFTDISIGAKYFNAISKRRYVQYGVAIYHLNKPKNSFFFDTNPDRIYRKLVLHGGMRMPFKRKIDIMPSAMICIQGPSLEINQGAFARFQVTEARSKDLMAYSLGFWLRESRAIGKAFLFDALNVVSKMEFNNYTIGFSYDINISGMAATTRLQGGPELSFSYTGIMNASLGNKKRPYCPTF